ncbi:hypothetical protein MRX96_056338, partial [Rhipicephalus microplus]
CGELESTGRVYKGEPISRERIPWILDTVAKFYGMDESVE